MKLRRRSRLSAFEAINVTPLIDVVMCLIIFFLIVGKMAHDQVTGLRLPSTAVGDSGATGRMVVIAVVPLKAGEATDGAFAPGGAARVRVGGVAVRDDAELRKAIVEGFVAANAAGAASGPGAAGPATTARDESPVPVQIRADRDAPYGLIEPALRACQDLKLTSVLLVTERANPPEGGGA